MRIHKKQKQKGNFKVTDAAVHSYKNLYGTPYLQSAVYLPAVHYSKQTLSTFLGSEMI